MKLFLMELKEVFLFSEWMDITGEILDLKRKRLEPDYWFRKRIEKELFGRMRKVREK